MISIKIHNSYRTVVAVCDSDLIGKKFEEGKRQLDLRANFYEEEKLSYEEIVNLMEGQAENDATFNIVGEKSIKAALEAGIINTDSIDKIAGIPFTLILV